MNDKDLRASSTAFKKEIEKKVQLKKMFLERTSRPRAQENVINPKLKGI